MTFLGYVGFVVLYAFIYRDFATMKAIFIYPAILALPILFITAIQKLRAWQFKLLMGFSIILFGLYIADVVSLTLRLIAINGILK